MIQNVLRRNDWKQMNHEIIKNNEIYDNQLESMKKEMDDNKMFLRIYFTFCNKYRISRH